ncbi:MAG TPA: hypothetical protein VII31_14820 [Caldimonas sp.]
MQKLPILTFDGTLMAVNVDYIVKIEEREGRDGTLQCTILFANGHTLRWHGSLSALTAELLK